MSIAHLSARSVNIVNKFSEISAIAQLHKFDLFAFLETWLNSAISMPIITLLIPPRLILMLVFVFQKATIYLS